METRGKVRMDLEIKAPRRNLWAHGPLARQASYTSDHVPYHYSSSAVSVQYPGGSGCCEWNCITHCLDQWSNSIFSSFTLLKLQVWHLKSNSATVSISWDMHFISSRIKAAYRQEKSMKCSCATDSFLASQWTCNVCSCRSLETVSDESVKRKVGYNNYQIL